MEILAEAQLPVWMPAYPPEYRRLIAQNLVDFAPWHLLDAARSRLRTAGVRTRYPNRQLLVFAARQDQDDLACWEAGRPGCVVIIHDFAAAGWEGSMEFATFWDWFRQAIAEMIDQGS